MLAIATEREPRVLCLEGAPAASRVALPRALAAEHIATDVRAARGLPRDFDFGRYDLVVLADVPRAALPDPTLAALDGFVRQGGGLLVAGGTQSFGPGGYIGDAPGARCCPSGSTSPTSARRRRWRWRW